MKIGIFGGTFDPPHVGHLIAAQDAFETLGLDRVLFIPARLPPHKQHEKVSEAAVRLQMIEAATAGNPNFEVSDVELERTGPSYTVDTIRELRKQRPDDQFYLLLGVDQVQEFSTWREPDEVLKLCRVAMLTRSGIEEAAAGDIVYRTVPVTRVDVSSTQVRQRVASGKSVRYLVSEAVERIIAAVGLYSGRSG